MRVILLVEPDEAKHEILVDECNGAGLVIEVSDPLEASELLRTLKFDLAIVDEERLAEPCFGVLFSKLRLTAPYTKLLSLPLPSCPP